MPFGKIEPFDICSGQWSKYVRRVEQFMLLNEIKVERKVATLITLVGERTYNLLCDLCAPNNPEVESYDELVRLVKNHLEPDRSKYAERECFRQRKQKQGETVAHYLQHLRHLASSCQFGTSLDENLCEQFVTGLNSIEIKSRLLSDRHLTYKTAVERALGLEAAEKHVERVSGRYSVGGAGLGQGFGGASTSGGGGGMAAGGGLAAGAASGGGEGMHVVRYASPATRPQNTCWRCGKPHHADKCRFKNYTCDVCKMKGHLKAMCKSNKNNNKYHNYMEDDSNCEMYNIRAVSSGDKPYYLDVKIDDKILKFELDTGSKISAINDCLYQEMFSNYKIHCDDLQLLSYSGSRIEPIGFIMVTAGINNEIQENLQLYVIKNGSRPLIGRCWIRRFNINELYINSLIPSDYTSNDQFIQDLINEYPIVFSNKLGKCKKEIRLQLVDKEPVFVRARPVPLALRAAVERELRRLEAEGSIYPVEHSDYGTPIVPVIKSSGEIRICGDYKTTINPKLKMDHYPLPHIDELFATLSGGEEFSKIDLTTAYMQVPLHPDSQPYTAITTHLGTFAFRRTPYGINCVPEKFQKITEETLRGIPNTVVFLDDICVTGKDRDTHKKNLRAVIERLASMGLTVKISKCQFLQKSVSYLGFIIDRNGLHPDPSKVEAIVKAPTPRNVTQLKSFLGLINYYAKFIPNISSLLHPLYELLKKDQTWIWSDNCEYIFNKIKNMLASDKVLGHYDASLPLVLAVDSSAYGLGAVLAHLYADGSERPISCASRTLTDAEVNYSQLDKEAAAIMFGVRKHHQYLYGRSFILKTDHKPLIYIFGPKVGIPHTAASRLQRWAAELAAYDFKIQFVTSKCNGNADALSRLPLPIYTECVGERQMGVTSSGEEHHYLLFVDETLPVSYKDIALETKRDKILSRVYNYVMLGWPNKCEIEELKPYYYRKSELYIEQGCIVYRYRIIIPTILRKKILNELHAGHLGIVKMKSMARNYVYWANIDNDIELVGQNCNTCRGVRDSPPRTCLHPWEFPAAPWQRLHADFGQLYGKYYIVIVDAHSKWIEVEEIRSTSAKDTIKIFRNLFAKFGLPVQLVTDNGPPFQSHEFQDFCEKNIIRHTTSSPYRPQGNGAAENSVKVIKKTIKKAVSEGKDIQDSLCRFLFQYRNCEHATTGVAPAVALLGHKLRNRLDAIRPNTAEKVREAQEKQIVNKGGVPRSFEVGQKVLTRDYSTYNNKWEEGRVSEKTGPVSYKIMLDSGDMYRRHADQIWPLRHQQIRMSTQLDVPAAAASADAEQAKYNAESTAVDTDKTMVQDGNNDSFSGSDYEDCVEPEFREQTTVSQDKAKGDAEQPTTSVDPGKSLEGLSERARRAYVRN